MEVTDAIRGLTVRPYSVRAVEQLPEALLELAKSRLPEGQAIEGIFVVPPETHKHGFAWRLNPLQALIFTKQGVPAPGRIFQEGPPRRRTLDLRRGCFQDQIQPDPVI